jgi:hypothetical protein
LQQTVHSQCRTLKIGFSQNDVCVWNLSGICKNSRKVDIRQEWMKHQTPVGSQQGLSHKHIAPTFDHLHYHGRASLGNRRT